MTVGLFEARYPGWTACFGFLDATVDQVLTAATRGGTRDIEAWEDARTLENIFAAGISSPNILAPTRSSWLGIFDYNMRSHDYVAQLLSKDAGCTAVVVWLSDTNRRLDIYDSGRATRHIQASDQDGRWEFDQSGEPLPFEDLEAYQRRRVRDRFTPEMLEAYCAALGLRPFDPDFYLASGIVHYDDEPVPLLSPVLRFLRRKTTVRRIR